MAGMSDRRAVHLPQPVAAAGREPPPHELLGRVGDIARGDLLEEDALPRGEQRQVAFVRLAQASGHLALPGNALEPVELQADMRRVVDSGQLGTVARRARLRDDVAQRCLTGRDTVEQQAQHRRRCGRREQRSFRIHDGRGHRPLAAIDDGEARRRARSWIGRAALPDGEQLGVAELVTLQKIARRCPERGRVGIADDAHADSPFAEGSSVSAETRAMRRARRRALRPSVRGRSRALRQAAPSASPGAAPMRP